MFSKYGCIYEIKINYHEGLFGASSIAYSTIKYCICAPHTARLWSAALRPSSRLTRARPRYNRPCRFYSEKAATDAIAALHQSPIRGGGHLSVEPARINPDETVPRHLPAVKSFSLAAYYLGPAAVTCKVPSITTNRSAQPGTIASLACL